MLFYKRGIIVDVMDYTPEKELKPPSTSNMLPVTKLEASLNR